MINQNRSNSCRLRTVGDWKEGLRMKGIGLGFSPDGRLLVVDRGRGIVALIEAETGRVVANLEDPNQCWFGAAIFSPDGAHLYLPSDVHRAAYVWDLRSVRRQLAAMGLDWDWPALPESAAPATVVAPLRFIVDTGRHDFSRLPFSQAEIERLDTALAADPDEWHALLRRAWIFTRCGRDAEAVADLTRALGLRPGDHRALTTRAEALFHQGQYEASFSDSEAALPAAPDQAAAHNNLAWAYVTVPPPARDAAKALPHARRGVELMPKVAGYHNTLGIVLARLGRHRESVDELETSLAASSGGDAAYDLFFLAIDYHRLGDPVRAKACYDRAVRHEVESRLPSKQAEELRAFHAEAEAVLSAPIRRRPG
jgi:tetratricopeptide (TPR) repeat protein